MPLPSKIRSQTFGLFIFDFFVTRLFWVVGLGPSMLKRRVPPRHLPRPSSPTTQPQNTPCSTSPNHPPPMAPSALSATAPCSKCRKVPPDGLSVVTDARNTVFYSLMKPLAPSPLGHINTVLRHFTASELLLKQGDL